MIVRKIFNDHVSGFDHNLNIQDAMPKKQGFESLQINPSSPQNKNRQLQQELHPAY